jgi:Lysylphosphatidylglycerol synthase TM region
MYFSFVIGFALLSVMVWQVGVVGLLESFHLMGLWIVPFLLLQTIPLFLQTAGWAACFPEPRPPLRLWQLFLVRQAGSAISQMTPTATIGGEVTKVLLLEHAMPQEQTTAAVVIDKASITLANMVYIALGMLYIMYNLPLPTEL